MATCFLAPLAVLARAVAACARAGGGPTARAACAACRHSNLASRYDAYNAHTGHNTEDHFSRLFFMLTKQAKIRTAHRPHISALLSDTLARALHPGRQLSQTTWRRCSAAHAGRPQLYTHFQLRLRSRTTLKCNTGLGRDSRMNARKSEVKTKEYV